MHKLSAKLTLWMVLILTGIWLLELILASYFPPLFRLMVLVPLITFSLYITGYRVIAKRIEFARKNLRRIRKKRFRDLEALRVPSGDELNALIWQVYRIGKTMQAEIDQLQEAENYRREFLGNVSHELKTPTFAIQGFAETLLDGALEDENVRRRFVDKIYQNAGRLNDLTDDLIHISQIETGELEMEMAPFNLKSLVDQVIETLNQKAIVAEVRLFDTLSDDLSQVQGDRIRIRQVLLNLVDNAIKYNAAGGQVEISARPLYDNPNCIRIAIHDTGIGIKKEHLSRLTERFFRADKSRSRQKGGTGLGLSIIKHILEKHDQKLVVSSTLGSGSTFRFDLPVAVESTIKSIELPD